MEDISIIDTTIENVAKLGVCGYKNIKKEGFPEKFKWLKKHFPEGLIIKTLYSEKDGTQGMIEYIPGKYCWRPVDASNYMFIHCIFVGFKKDYKKRGYASLLLKECEKDAKKQKLNGVAVVTRKGSFMAGNEIFIKNGFEIVDSAKPDFELLVRKLNKTAPSPKFKNTKNKELTKYTKGLTIIRAGQCPYSVKNVREIVETAKQDYGIKATIVNLKNYKEARSSPCSFGTFCIIYNGTIVAEHPISKGRFVNIMNKIKT
ncbi:MAG: GNAT family N-acetyltransferase [candidate division Zixibacteria bacterium]|nr:GNAT family N-acetyltransferase [candidate division Zixibacteria bacterium]